MAMRRPRKLVRMVARSSGEVACSPSRFQAPRAASKACAEIVSASYRSSFLHRDDGRGQRRDADLLVQLDVTIVNIALPAILFFLWMLSLSLKNEIDNKKAGKPAPAAEVDPARPGGHLGGEPVDDHPEAAERAPQ